MGYKEIGKKIQQFREAAGLSQDELAKALGCSQSALSNYELGKRRLYLSKLEQIARILGKPLSAFLEPDPEEPNEEQLRYVLSRPQLWRLVLEASRLPESDLEALIDYVRWKRSQQG
jgi:transcriptional regulator with XRE-family HTH domain